MFSVACVSFDGNQCRIHLKHFSQLWEAILWNRTRQHRGSYPTLHTSPNRPHPVLIRKRSGSHPQANSVSPASQSPPPPLMWKQVSSAENISPSFPPGTFLSSAKQTAHPFLPSLRRQLPNSLVCSCMSGDGQGEESRAGLLLLPLLEAMVSRGQCSVTRLPFQQQLSLCSSLSCSSRNKTFLVSVQNFGLHGSRSDASHLLGPCLLNQLEREEQETQLFPSHLGASCAASLQ